MATYSDRTFETLRFHRICIARRSKNRPGDDGQLSVIGDIYLKCSLLEKDDLHPQLWVGADKKWRKGRNDQAERKKFNKVGVPMPA